MQNVLNNFNPKDHPLQPRQSWITNGEIRYIRQNREHDVASMSSLLQKCSASEMTGSFLHLHLAIQSEGLDLDSMEAHYTIMDRSIKGNGSAWDGPCGELNMIAVSNPCIIDKTLAPKGYIIIHAYSAANEPFEIWKDMKRNSRDYVQLKRERCEVLWRAVESIIPDVRIHYFS